VIYWNRTDGKHWRGYELPPSPGSVYIPALVTRWVITFTPNRQYRLRHYGQTSGATSFPTLEAAMTHAEHHSGSRNYATDGRGTE
jgi:hypothetical protein